LANYYADNPERLTELQGYYVGGEMYGGVLASFAIPAGVEAGIARGETFAIQLASKELMIAANPATGNPRRDRTWPWRAQCQASRSARTA
jgi:hypothetical protein